MNFGNEYRFIFVCSQETYNSNFEQNILNVNFAHAPVAQLDRAFDFGSKG